MSNNTSGLHPLAYMGVEARKPPTLVRKAFAPESNNTEFAIGTIWIDTSMDSVYILTNLDGGSATWTSFEATPLDVVTDSGTATESNKTVNIVGTNNITTSGAGDTVTVTLTNGSDGQVIIGGGSAPTWANLTSSGGSVLISNTANGINLEATGVAGLGELDGDSGAALPTMGVIVIAGGSNITTSGSASTLTVALDNDPSVSGSLTAGTSISSGTTITAGTSIESTTTMTCGTGLTVSAGGIDSTGTTTFQDLGIGVVLSDASGVLSNANGTDGQVLIAATGSSPAWASLTSSGGTVTITPGANTLNLEATAGGGTIPWTSSASTPVTMSVNNGYIIPSGTLVERKLPATSAVGDILRITVSGNGISFKITQNAGQYIKGRSIAGSAKTTTTGTAGYLTHDAALEMVCTVANTGWYVISYAGTNMTYV